MAPGFIPQQPRARRALLAAVVGVPLLVAGLWWHLAGREVTDDAQIDGHITPIAARVGGTVLAVRVTDNQKVQAGALLVEIDPRDYQVALRRAEADLADAEAALEAARAGVPITTTTTSGQLSSAGASVERAQAGVLVASSDVDASRARLAAAQARRREATASQTRLARDLDRMKQLVAKDEISQQQFDAAVAGADASRAAAESAQAVVTETEKAVVAAENRKTQALGALTQAQADLRTAGTGPEQVTIIRSRQRSAEARVQLARALVEQAQMNLAYTTVKAPGDGYVEQEVGRAGPGGPGRPAAGGAGVARRHLGDGQLQGERNFVTCAPASRHRSRSTRTAGPTRATWTASPPRPAPGSASCRPRTPPATT